MFENIDFGSWGWYFDDNRVLRNREREFLKSFVQISFKYGVNLSVFGLDNEFLDITSVDRIVEGVFSSTSESRGNTLQKAIHFNFYSQRTNSRFLPSLVYAKTEGKSINSRLIKDDNSKLFCTLKEGEFHSLFYNARTDVFLQEDEEELLPYLNTARYNSYIKDMHSLMSKYQASLFDCTRSDFDGPFTINKDGYILYENDLLFYDEVYDLLPNKLKYEPFEQVPGFEY